MRYEKIRPAVFLARPNRFIAHVELEGKLVVAHVKNTGRCRELLLPGAKVYLQEADSHTRKTKFDLIAVEKGHRLINMDAQAPNRIFAQWIHQQEPEITVHPEYRYGDSRLDFYLEAGQRRVFAEVKGVTLEDAGIVRFPDAPTLRGVKHLRALMDCVAAGFDAWAVFIVQLRGARWFEPNRATHPEFADALVSAQGAGVHLLALDCDVTETSLSVHDTVPMRL